MVLKQRAVLDRGRSLRGRFSDRAVMQRTVFRQRLVVQRTVFRERAITVLIATLVLHCADGLTGT